MITISLYSPIILWEFNCFVILRVKFSLFALYFSSPRYLQLFLLNRLSNLSIIRFRIICVLDLNCNHVHNNLRVFEQMKRRVIISNKHGNCISELPHELPNNLRLRIVGNQEIPVEKSQNVIE